MKKIVLWGTGKIAGEVLNDCTTLSQYEIIGIIDNNSQKWGTEFEGYKVFSPDVLYNLGEIIVVVLTDAYEDIKNQIYTQYNECGVCVENKNFFYKESILKRYEQTTDASIKKIISHIKEYGLDVFNYSFANKYRCKNDVKVDEESGLYYVIHDGKKMYFPRTFKSKDSVNHYYNSILLEQDEESPHKYTSAEMVVNAGDVVIDVGAAEGNFGLEIIDKVSKLYLVEANPNWIEALKLTFQGYEDKVTIIQGFVSSYCDGNVFTLDSVINDSVNFIKMDIEGNEWDALRGAERIIKESNDIRLAICCYHSDFDQELIESFMDKKNIRHWTSDGYIWYPYKVRQTYISTQLNRVLVFGQKKASCII